MTNSEKFTYNVIAGLHNHSLIQKAEQLINSFLEGNDSSVFITNPDGTCVKLQPGVKLTSICGLGIE